MGWWVGLLSVIARLCSKKKFRTDQSLLIKQTDKMNSSVSVWVLGEHPRESEQSLCVGSGDHDVT